MHTYTYLYICIHNMRTYIYTVFDICTHAHTHIYIYIYIFTCIHTFRYLYMYTCSWQQSIFGLTRESPLGNGVGVAVPPLLHLVLWEVREVPKQDAWTYVAHGGQQSGVLTRKPCVFVCFSTCYEHISDPTRGGISKSLTPVSWTLGGGKEGGVSSLSYEGLLGASV